MKKGYYVHFDVKGIPGVAKKLDMQIAELSKFYDMTEINIRSAEVSLTTRLLRLLPGGAIARTYQEALEEINDPTFVYVRRATADKYYVSFFKELKARWPECKVIVEIFTYPYDKDDFAKWNAWPFYFKEIACRSRLKRYVDRFVTYTKDEEIFGVSTICTTNGIDCNTVRCVRGEYKDKELHLIGVAYMQRQHGYERVIQGLAQYYKQRNNDYRIYLDLVGDGPEKCKYQRLAEKYHLEEYIAFFPTTKGEELEELYDRADIALAAFGMYKVGYYEPIGAIKTRECLAKGLPMISGSPIDIVNEGSVYAKIFSNDRAPVDMEEVLTFFENIKKQGKTKKNVAMTLRKYAEIHASMSTVMYPIVEYIETERG